MLAREDASLVSAGMVHHPLRSRESFPASFANVVFVVLVHMLVETQEHLVSLPADLTAVLLLAQLVRQHAVPPSAVDDLSVYTC